MLIYNLKVVLAIFLAVSVALLAGLVVQQYRSQTRLFTAAGENKAALRSRYAQAGRILDRNGVILAQSRKGQRVYQDDAVTAKAVLHVVGDYTHNIANTIEARYQGQLLGSGRNPLHQLLLDLTGRGLAGDDVRLTIDSALSRKAYRLLDGRAGAVVMLDYRTGAILVSVSSPSASPQSVIAFQDFPETSLFDRAFQGFYAPGSIFKILTAAAWMQSPVFETDLVVNCRGIPAVNSSGAREAGNGHGQVGLAEAFAESCNVFFGQVGAAAGRDALLAAAGQFGFGEKIMVDKLDASISQITTSDNPAVLSWLAIGQPTADSILQISPLQLAMIAGAIGNAGVMQQPHIVLNLTDPLGIQYQKIKSETQATILEPEAAGQLEDLMLAVTREGTGKAAAVKGLDVAGKTGTVQVEGKNNNALYVGYITDDRYPVAIAVVVEGGGSGGQTAAPIAAALLKEAVKEAARLT